MDLTYRDCILRKLDDELTRLEKTKLLKEISEKELPPDLIRHIDLIRKLRDLMVRLEGFVPANDDMRKRSDDLSRKVYELALNVVRL